MPERIYGSERPHEILLRENYNTIYKEIYRQIKGLSATDEVDFGYADYLEGKLSDSEKRTFDEKVTEVLAKYQDKDHREEIPAPLRKAIGFIQSSAAVASKDKLTDLDHFYAFGEKTGDASTYRASRREATPSSAARSEHVTVSSTSGASARAHDEHRAEATVRSSTRTFAGYDKKLTFFQSIKKAYKDRKTKTNSRLAGIVSGARAAFCKAKWPLTIIGLAAIGTPAGAILAGSSLLPVGTTLVNLTNLLASTTTLFVGTNLVGFALQKIEDGKINHGIFGGLFTKKNDTEERDFPTPGLTEMPTPRLEESDERDHEHEAREHETPEAHEVHDEHEEHEMPVADIPEEAHDLPEEAKEREVAKEEKEEDDVIAMMEKYDTLKRKLDLIEEAKERGLKELPANYRDMKLDLEELYSKISRHRPLSNNIEDLEAELRQESEAYNHYESEDRMEAAKATLLRIREINEKLHSLKNTNSLVDISTEWLEEYRAEGVGMNPERERIAEVLYRNYNTRIINELNKKTSDDSEAVNLAATPTAIRLEDLEIGQKLAVKKGHHALAEEFEQEINTIKPNSSELSEDEIASYVNRRIRNLKAAKRKIAENLDFDSDSLFGSDLYFEESEISAENAQSFLDNEINLLQKRYRTILNKNFVNAANWGTNPSFSPEADEDLKEEDTKTR